jgi:hypothetical protein
MTLEKRSRPHGSGGPESRRQRRTHREGTRCPYLVVTRFTEKVAEIWKHNVKVHMMARHLRLSSNSTDFKAKVRSTEMSGLQSSPAPTPMDLK